MPSRVRLRLLTFALVCCLFAPTIATAQDGVTLPPWRRDLPEGRASANIVVGETELEVDLAITPGEQTLGLGYRNGLEPGTGMLFVGTRDEPKTFWMKGMRFCLDIIWITDGQIAGAAENACPDPTGTPDHQRARFSSEVPVTHVLEVPAGWMEENGYGPGTPVDLSTIPEAS
jgi:uncharacterized membrane protein (UPF0127 family)